MARPRDRKLKPALPRPIIVWAPIDPQTMTPLTQWSKPTYGEVRKLFSSSHVRIVRFELCPVDYPTSRKILKTRIGRLKKAQFELTRHAEHLSPCDYYIHSHGVLPPGSPGCTCGLLKLLTRLEKVR